MSVLCLFTYFNCAFIITFFTIKVARNHDFLLEAGLFPIKIGTVMARQYNLTAQKTIYLKVKENWSVQTLGSGTGKSLNAN